MTSPTIPGPLRERLATLIAEDQLDGERLLERLRDLRALEAVPTCSGAVWLLAHVQLAEDDAEQLLRELTAHRQILGTALGRDPGLRVSAIDYLSNIRPLLRNPTIIEHASLERTERSVITDDLTRLYNRRYFQNALELEVRRSRRYVLPMSLLMLDLDMFKTVNDVYGHPFGDLVLEQIGVVMRRAVRESDLACRVGGEEFAVILSETDRLGALAVAERICRSVRTRFSERPTGDRVVAMTVSGGIASYPQDGDEASLLSARADQALYHAKTRGRNRVVIYHAERRGAIRYPVRSDTGVRVHVAGDKTIDDVGLVNLSVQGALLMSGSVLQSEAALRLTLGRLEAPEEQIEIDGRVVRIDSAGERGDRVAIAFDSALPEEFLREQIQRSPTAEPAGRRRR